VLIAIKEVLGIEDDLFAHALLIGNDIRNGT